ncbi:MAG: BolA family protein [Woeseiaceae bacterium]
MSKERLGKIEGLIRAALEPTEFRLKDQSHLHAGHAGASSGMGHFDVFLRSKAFEGKTKVKRHQMVYQAVGDMMQTDIHALSIRALTPEE